MKVVLFCGGFGTRLREHSETIPKPLVNIGYRPILWHLMRYYAHYGHKDFVLCLGYRGDLIKRFFLDFEEEMSNDFVLHGDGSGTELLASDIGDWRITFVDTGLHANIGERLLAVRRFLKDDEIFLANYADGLSDLPLDRYVAEAVASDAVATIMAARSAQSLHAVKTSSDGRVTSITRVDELDIRINAGFFVLRKEIFDYLQPGEELVEKPFERLIASGRLRAYRHDGFWGPMDTLKDKISYDRRHARGDAPWEVWNHR